MVYATFDRSPLRKEIDSGSGKMLLRLQRIFSADVPWSLRRRSLYRDTIAGPEGFDFSADGFDHAGSIGAPGR